MNPPSLRPSFCCHIKLVWNWGYGEWAWKAVSHRIVMRDFHLYQLCNLLCSMHACYRGEI